METNSTFENDLLESIGLDLGLLEKEASRTNKLVRGNLELLCHSMNERGIPLMEDYFDYIPPHST